MKRLTFYCLLSALILSSCTIATPTPRIVVIVPDRTPVPTWTLPPSITPSPAFSGAETLPTGLTSTPAETATATPTARPGIDPTLGITTPNPYATHVTPIPEPMPQLFLEKDILNILLIGRDTARDSKSYRTDVLIVVSINKRANSVTLLTIPRDLFVYIPGWTMNRINTAASYGDSIDYPGGGVALLEQTILYNLGIPIHGWARIDFSGFKQVIDTLGGVEVPVSCAMQDWRLKNPYDPTVDVQDANNWELYTVEVGVQHMDGDLALWYARSRKRSSDYDRSRRQHQVLRAMLEKALQLNMLAKVPELYQKYIQIVDTDLGLGDVLQFVPLAAKLDRARIKSRFIGRDHVWPWTTPQGANVLLPDRNAISALLAEAFQPPPQNMLVRSGPAVEVWNGTTNSAFWALAEDNLNWAGLAPVRGQADRTDYATTMIYDFTTSPKGSIRAELQRALNVSDANVIVAPDPNAPYPYRVVLGADYNPCVKPQYIVRETPTPEPGVVTIGAGEPVRAARVLEPPPRVDGDLAEWTALVYASNQPTFGGQNRADGKDLSASWNIAWDDRYLYLALKVKDDALVQAATGELLYKGDSLELWIGVDPGNRDRQLTEREFQIGLSAGDLSSGGTPEAYLWWPHERQGPIRDALIAAQPVEGGYALEAAVPWSVLELTPFAGEGFAFVLAVNDDDTPGAPEQETQTTNVKGARLRDPRTWGVLVLEPAPGE
ncbi:MAG: LCP family protein [Anaerolineales bacterium]|nr:LCP family protein [Anaerolineales bacterium]